MIRKKVLLMVLLAGALCIWGCGGKSAKTENDTSATGNVASSTESMESGKSETESETISTDSTDSQVTIESSGKETPEVFESVPNEAGENVAQDDADMSVSTVEPLNMDADEIEFYSLLEQIGVPINEARASLGLDGENNEKDSVIFGETVRVTVKSSEDNCSSIQLSFLGTPIDSLQNAISEQVGEDGDLVDNGILWRTDKAFVLLYESAEGCYVDIGLE